MKKYFLLSLGLFSVTQSNAAWNSTANSVLSFTEQNPAYVLYTAAAASSLYILKKITDAYNEKITREYIQVINALNSEALIRAMEKLAATVLLYRNALPVSHPIALVAEARINAITVRAA